MSAPQTISPAEAETALLELNQELNRLQRTIRMAIQDQLSKMVGRSFEELERNRELAESIHQLLDSHGLRVQCLECGHPAILRVSPRGNGSGVFVFDHTIDGKRTFHGGRKTVPIIRLVAKPPRKPRQNIGQIFERLELQSADARLLWDRFRSGQVEFSTHPESIS